MTQDPAPYARVEDGITRLMATSTEEWAERLLRLIDDAARRRSGEAPREEVLAKHTIEEWRPPWEAPGA